MDPLSALSVAAAAVQFVDYSATVMKGMIEVYRFLEEKDLPRYFQQMKTDARRLSQSNKSLKQSLGRDQLGRSPTEIEHQLIAISSKSLEISEEIINVLDDVQPDMLQSRMQAMRKALKAVWKKDMLESLKQQMLESRDQLMFVILLNLRDEIKTVANNLLSKRNSVFHWQGSPDIGTEILEKLENVKNSQENLSKALKDAQSSDAVPSNELSYNDMTLWARIPIATSLINGLLSSLEFRTITERQTRIEDAHTQTFEWIFNSDAQSSGRSCSMAEWLQFSPGLYWITGKAGSGKSTLLKFLTHHSKTKRILGSWAGQREPIIASFYFWHAGSEMQTSQEGLLRTLLFQAISQYRRIAPENFPGRWESLALARDVKHQNHWSWTELEQAFRFLLEDQDPSIKFCFFIDGLDEFKGDLNALILLVQRISLYPNVKVCVSSRPWILFEDAFRKKPQLMLQDLTQSDVLQYAQDKLSVHPGFLELRSMDPDLADSFIHNIARKASGVFLWVVVVIRSLLEGLRDGDRLSDLQNRLDALPPELDDLFKRILHNFNPIYFSHASALFQIFRASIHPPSLIQLSFADEADPGFAVTAEVKPMTTDQKLYRALAMRRRLDSRCKGLLEITPIHIGKNPKEVSYLRDVSQITIQHADIIANTKVEYMHRSVKDFLQQDGTWEEITAATESSFNANSALARGFLIDLKWMLSTSGAAAEGAWDGIFWILKYASLSEKEGFSQFRLLEALDQAASKIFAETCDTYGQTLLERHGDGVHKPVHWCGAKALFSPKSTFLDLSIQCGLALYLEEKLAKEPLDQGAIEWLLHIAVKDFNIGYLGPGAPELWSSKPDMDIVNTLLAHSNLSSTARARWLAQAQDASETIPYRVAQAGLEGAGLTKLMRRGTIKKGVNTSTSYGSQERSLHINGLPPIADFGLPVRNPVPRIGEIISEELPEPKILHSSSAMNPVVSQSTPLQEVHSRTTDNTTAGNSSKRRSKLHWPFRHQGKKKGSEESNESRSWAIH